MKNIILLGIILISISLKSQTVVTPVTPYPTYTLPSLYNPLYVAPVDFYNIENYVPSYLRVYYNVYRPQPQPIIVVVPPAPVINNITIINIDEE